jgi:hypothetical protein
MSSPFSAANVCSETAAAPAFFAMSPIAQNALPS